MARRRQKARRSNPQFRYVVVPVDLNDDEEADVAYIVRVPSKNAREEGIRAVARAVPADALINVVDARSFAYLKKGDRTAMKEAVKLAPRTEILEEG